MTQRFNDRVDQLPPDNKPSFVLSTPEKLQDEIERDPHYQRAQKQKQQTEAHPPNWMLRFLLAFLASFVIDHRTLQGEKLVTPEADKTSRLLAITGSITNLIGTIGITPIILFTMGGLGVVSLPLAGALLYLLNSVQNSYTVSVARRAANPTIRDRAGLLGIIAMQTLLTAASIGGMLILNSQTTLANYYAARLVEEKKQQIFAQRDELLASPATAELKQKCEAAEAAIETYPANHPNRDHTIITAYGSLAERKRLGVTATPESYCGQRDLRLKEIEDQFNASLAPQRQAESTGKPPLTVLQAAYPDTYDLEFEAGRIADGNTAIAVGFSYAVEQISEGNISSLGSSLLFFGLSAATSTALVMALLIHCNRRAILLSFCDEAEIAVIRFFEPYANATPQSEAEAEALEVILLYHQQHVAVGGVAAIPSLTTYIRAALAEGSLKLPKPPGKGNSGEQREQLVDALDRCIYQLRGLLHTLAMVATPHTYGVHTNLTVTTDGTLAGQIDEFPYVVGEKLRELRSIVSQVRRFALLMKRDVSNLIALEQVVVDLLRSEQIKQQLCVVEQIQPQKFLFTRFESLDRLQNECHLLLD